MHKLNVINCMSKCVFICHRMSLIEVQRGNIIICPPQTTRPKLLLWSLSLVVNFYLEDATWRKKSLLCTTYFGLKAKSHFFLRRNHNSPKSLTIIIISYAHSLLLSSNILTGYWMPWSYSSWESNFQFRYLKVEITRETCTRWTKCCWSLDHLASAFARIVSSGRWEKRTMKT